MDRRQAINRVAFIMGASFISTELFIGCKADTSISSRKEHSSLGPQAALIGEIGDIILPPYEKHPGFKAINGQQAALSILEDCYKQEDIAKILTGLDQLESDVKKKFNKTFTALSEQEKFDTINAIDQAYFDKTKEATKPEYYGIIKEAILLVYFCDKMVMDGAMTYIKVPGKYDGAMKTDANSHSVIYGLGI